MKNTKKVISIRSFIFHQMVIYVAIAAFILIACYIAADAWYWKELENKFEEEEYRVIYTIDEYKQKSLEFFERNNIGLLLLDDDYEIVYHKGIKNVGELYDIEDDISYYARYLHSQAISEHIDEGTIEAHLTGLYYIDEYVDENNEILTGYIVKTTSDKSVNTPKVIATVYTASLVVITLVVVVLFVYFLINRIYKKVKQSYKLISSNIEKVPYDKKSIDIDEIHLIETVDVAQTYNDMIDEMSRINKEKADLAESSNRLISNLSHDLKSPLTTLKGYSEMMLSDENDIEKLKTCARFINKSTMDLDYLVNVLFEQIKMQNTDYNLNLERVDINEFLRGICANYYMIFTDKGFEMDVDIPESKTYISIDRENLKRVFVNILENCYHHNIVPTKVLIESKQEKDCYVVRIKDDGMGIPDEAADKLFEAFYQADSSRHSNNSGLGLFIAKQIVKKHGGEIVFKSEKNYKTVFEIRLPIN